MKKICILFPIILCYVLASGFVASAQSPNEKQITRLEAKIAEDSAKLVKLKSLVSPFEKDKKETAENAQQSADDNKRAAERLSNDPQDKKLARKAKNASSDAKRDARKARVAADKLDDLNKDISKQTKQLAKEKDKLQNIQTGQTSSQ